MTKTRTSSQLIPGVLLSLLLLSTSALAMEEQPRSFRGIRSEAMGGLLYTTGNYSEALFGNPARLSEVDTWKFTMFETMLEVNTNVLSTASDLSSLKNASGSNTISSATKLIGKNEHLLAQFLTGYYNPNFIGDLGFGVALLTAAHSNLTVNYTTDIDTQTIFDIGPNFDFSHPFFDNALSLGLNIHFLYRVAADDTINSLNFLTGGKLSFSNFGRQGFGLDADLGGYYHIPWEIPFMRLSVAAAVTGLTKSHFDEIRTSILKGPGVRPTNDDRLFHSGIRCDFPDWWWFSAPIFAFEVQDTGDSQKRISFAKKTHFGAEGKLSRVFSLRLGLNQGYATAGLGVDLPVVKLDFSTYGEELSGNSGQREDRRFAFRLAFEL